ncbi:MAG: 2-isopropylmalate synthase [Armatimonadota bacterium]|jgi:2-isopropylmalate synthase
MARKIHIFDTTLRDGEQAPGASLNVPEKLQIAHQLARLKVDVIEAGFPISSPEDFEAVKTIAGEVRGPAIAGLARAREEDVTTCWQAVQGAKKPRIHTFIATSDVHVEQKFRKTHAEILKMAVDAVAYARSLCDDVEFSTEDAGRTNREYLAEVVEGVIDAGATVVNIPDTVGYTSPWEFAQIIRYLVETVPNIKQTRLSVHCHDDLGQSVANSLAAVREGVEQVECCINGMGERAGNAALEEIVMAIKTRGELFDARTTVNTREIVRASKMVSTLTGFPVPPNKAIVGANAFAHGAGIHIHGVLSDRRTYEIMTPEHVGLSGSRIVLTRRSGRHGLRKRLADLGYELGDQQLEEAYERFLTIADRRREVTDSDLEAIVHNVVSMVPETYQLESVQTTSGTEAIPTATVRVRRGEETVQDAACGNGPVDAIYKAIDRLTGVKLHLVDYHVRGVTGGKAAVGEASVRVERNGHTAVGIGAHTDVLEASAMAYLNAVNKILHEEQGAEAARSRRRKPAKKAKKRAKKPAKKAKKKATKKPKKKATRR